MVNLSGKYTSCKLPNFFKHLGFINFDNKKTKFQISLWIEIRKKKLNETLWWINYKLGMDEQWNGDCWRDDKSDWQNLKRKKGQKSSKKGQRIFNWKKVKVCHVEKNTSLDVITLLFEGSFWSTNLFYIGSSIYDVTKFCTNFTLLKTCFFFSVLLP